MGTKENKFRGTQENAGDLGASRKRLGENAIRKSRRFRVTNGTSNKGDMGGGKSENRATCLEFGHADHFKAISPIWIKKKEKRKQENRKGK